MKTLREYIDIIKEAEQLNWKTVIANEVKARGLPQYFYYYAQYTYELPFRIEYDIDSELYAWFEDYGVGTWKVDEETGDYSDVNSLIQTIQTTLALNDGDNAIGEFDGKERDKGGSDGSVFDITNGWTPERDGSEQLAELEADYGTENVYGLYEVFNANQAHRIISMEPDHGDAQYVDISFGSNLTVVWDDLQIELHGPTPKIAKVSGELTSTAPKKTTNKPVPRPTAQNLAPQQPNTPTPGEENA